MVQIFTPPSVNIHTHSVNIHTPAHSHVCVRSCNVLEYDMDLLRHALGASTPPQCGAEKLASNVLSHISIESGEAENDKGYETTSWIDVVD